MSLLYAICRETFSRSTFARIPEPALVMSGDETVRDYTDCGEAGGALYGPYLYNAMQIAARIRPGARILDLGCGSGQLLNLVAGWNPDACFTGVDLSEDMLSEARSRASDGRLANVTYVNGDFSSLKGFESCAYDAVISSMALHHLPDVVALARTFRSVDRVLKPGGAVYLMDFGRLRSVDAVEIFVSKVRQSETEMLAMDYRASLLAAFSHTDFYREALRFRPNETTLYRTAISPLVVVVATCPKEKLPATTRVRFREAFARLSPQRRGEFRQLKWFLRFGGLSIST